MISKIIALTICSIVVTMAIGSPVENEEKLSYHPVPWVPGFPPHSWNQHWAHDWPFAFYPQHHWLEHPYFFKHPHNGDLHCFSCNENYAPCRYPFLNDDLKGNYISCNGQCVKFRNPDDNMLWYRGCSNERFSNAGHQPPVVVKDGIVYFFCDVNGCNIF